MACAVEEITADIAMFKLLVMIQAQMKQKYRPLLRPILLVAFLNMAHASLAVSAIFSIILKPLIMRVHSPIYEKVLR